MASSKAIVQDMPPAGGYKPLNWQKTIRPPVLGGAGIFGLYAGKQANIGTTTLVFLLFFVL
jgi:hypothetical protein